MFGLYLIATRVDKKADKSNSQNEGVCDNANHLRRILTDIYPQRQFPTQNSDHWIEKLYILPKPYA